MGCDVGDLHGPEACGGAAVELGGDGGSLGDREVGVAVGDDLPAGQVLEEPGDRGHPGGSPYQEDLVDVVPGHSEVLDQVHADILGGHEEVLGHGLELVPREGVLGAVAVVVERDRDALGDGEGLLVPLRGDDELVLCGQVVPGVDVVLVDELVADVLDDGRVPVLPSEDVVPLGSDDLDVALADPDDGHVERPSPEVVDHDRLVGGVLVSVGDRGGRRLVDDLRDLDAAGLAGADGGGPLEVVEVGGHRDDRLVDLLAGGLLGVGDQMFEKHSAQVLGGVVLAVEAHGYGSVPHVPLERGGVDASAVGLHVLGVLAHQNVTVVEEAYHRGCDLLPEGVGYDNGFVRVSVISCDCRVCCSEVYPNLHFPSKSVIAYYYKNNMTRCDITLRIS